MQESSHIVIKCYGTNFCEERLSLPARFQCASSGCGLSQAMQPVDFGVIEMFPQTAVTVDLLESFLRHIEVSCLVHASLPHCFSLCTRHLESPQYNCGLLQSYRGLYVGLQLDFFPRVFMFAHLYPCAESVHHKPPHRCRFNLQFHVPNSVDICSMGILSASGSGLRLSLLVSNMWDLRYSAHTYRGWHTNQLRRAICGVHVDRRDA